MSSPGYYWMELIDMDAICSFVLPVLAEPGGERGRGNQIIRCLFSTWMKENIDFIYAFTEANIAERNPLMIYAEEY